MYSIFFVGLPLPPHTLFWGMLSGGGGGVVGGDFFPPPLQIYSSSPPAKGWLASQCGPHAEPYSQLEVPPIYTWKRRSTTRARPSACWIFPAIQNCALNGLGHEMNILNRLNWHAALLKRKIKKLKLNKYCISLMKESPFKNYWIW
jgi:hypothetical protein